MIAKNTTADTRPIALFTVKHGAWGPVLAESHASMQSTLLNAPVRGHTRFLTVDIKSQRLAVGETTCIPGWHADTAHDPDALHHLIVWGVNRTEFKGRGMIDEGVWETYSHDLHRGPVVTTEETRLLVRITESNTIKGTSLFNYGDRLDSTRVGQA